MHGVGFCIEAVSQACDVGDAVDGSTSTDRKPEEDPSKMTKKPIFECEQNVGDIFIQSIIISK